jgi:hypothetical protein
LERDAAMTISVSLDPAQWAVVVQALSDAPWRLADPIIREVRARLDATAQPSASAPPSQPTAFEKLKDQLR